MKKTLLLACSILIINIQSSILNSASAQEVRVLRAHYAGDIIFQTPVHGLDSIKSEGPGFVSIYFDGGVWTRNAAAIDSLTFAMSGDTTFVADSTDIDASQRVRIVWDGHQVSILNPYSRDSLLITTDSGHVTVKSTTTAHVVYELSGYSDNGNLLFSKLSAPVTLRLNGLQLTSVGQAAIHIDKNQDVLLQLEKGKENRLADADSNADKAVLHGKGMITVQGEGSLAIVSAYANGLQGKRGVVIDGGHTTVTVTADTKKGVKSDMDFVMNDGQLEVTASGSVVIDTADTYATGYDFSYCSGIKAGDKEENSVGHIIVNGGRLTVTCSASNRGGRCLSSDYDILFNGGKSILTTAGAGQAIGGTGTNAKDGYVSTCISADRHVYLYGGRIDARSTGTGGRGLKADSTLVIGHPDADDSLLYLYIQTSGSPVNATSSGGGGWPGGGGSSSDYFKGLPKGIKVEGNIYFHSGHVGVYCTQTSGDPNGEAIESKDSIFIHGGTIEANSYDDALNAAKYLEVSGGKVWCYSRGNDAIDCNAVTYIHGGLIIAKGQEVGLDAGTDAGGRFTLTGGTLVLAGGNMGAWDSPNVSGYQKYLQLSNNGSNGLCVKNSGGTTVLMYKHSLPSNGSHGFVENFSNPGAKPPPSGGGSNSLVFSSPDVVSGSYSYWTTTTFSGGTHWHGFYTGATATTSGTSQSATVR